MKRVIFCLLNGLPDRNYFFFLLWVGMVVISFSTPGESQIHHQDEERFAFKVKQIDEFFERFNNQPTLIKEYAAHKYNMTEVSREELIKSLFNLRSERIDKANAINFIKLVNDPERPVHLSFYDDDWFARVRCSVTYQQQKRELFLILQVQKENQGVSKWVIQSVYADFFNSVQVADTTAFLNPISHGTDFLGLSKAFKEPKNLKSYLPGNYQEDQLTKFVLELRNGSISFQQVEEISYHFFQVDGWILTVENFQRAHQNSGWLISSLIAADEKAKKEYKQHILNLRI